MPKLRTSQNFGANPERSRDHNRRVVLEYLRVNGPAGRAEIAKSSALSTQTVSNIIAKLEQENILLITGRKQSARGQPPVQYAFNPDSAVALGFEIRPDAIICAVVNLGGENIIHLRVDLEDSAPETVISTIRSAKSTICGDAKIGNARILGAAVVMPGPFGNTGLSAVGDTVLQGWTGLPLKETLSNALELPVLVENDAIAAAIGERVHGVARDLDSFAYLYFGTGIGLGLISNGIPLYGAFGNAGEVGHVAVMPGGQLCSCGSYGCLETYASRISLRRHLEAAGIDASTGSRLLQLFRDETPEMREWLDRAIAPLSVAVSMIENIFDPETVILGGAMPDEILDHLIERLNLPKGSIAARPGRSIARAIRGKSGRMTAALGGAALVIHNATTPGIAATNEKIS